MQLKLQPLTRVDERNVKVKGTLIGVSMAKANPIIMVVDKGEILAQVEINQASGQFELTFPMGVTDKEYLVQLEVKVKKDKGSGFISEKYDLKIPGVQPKENKFAKLDEKKEKLVEKFEKYEQKLSELLGEDKKEVEIIEELEEDELDLNKIEGGIDKGKINADDLLEILYMVDEIEDLSVSDFLNASDQLSLSKLLDDTGELNLSQLLFKTGNVKMSEIVEDLEVSEITELIAKLDTGKGYQSKLKLIKLLKLLKFLKRLKVIIVADYLSRPALAKELEKLEKQTVLLVLKPAQLSILGQAFRPIICAEIRQVTKQYVELKQVNIKMSNAPEFIFPTPLIIPLANIALFFPFDSKVRFPLT